MWNKIKYYITMNIKKLFEKTSTGFKEFVAKVEFTNVIGLSEELAKYIKKDSNEYLKPDTNSYVANINPDMDLECEVPSLNVVYGDGSSDKVYLDLASEDNPGLMSIEDKSKLDNLPNLSNSDILTGIGNYEPSKSYINLVYKSTSTTVPYPKIRVESATSTLAGVMSADDKTKIDNYVGTKLNIPSITYINEEEKEYASIGYNGIKYTNGNTVFSVSGEDINVKNDTIRINEEEISFARGANSATLNQTGFIVDYTSTESADTSRSRVTVTSNSIKYNYFIDNSMQDKDNESGNFTYNFPKANGRLLVDSENEANPNFVNADKTKKLAIGYNGIEYNIINNEGYNDIVFNVTSDGTCNANEFSCSYSANKATIGTNITRNDVIIYNNRPFGNTTSILNNNSLTFSSSSSFLDEDGEIKLNNSSTIYSANNIKKGDLTFNLPKKSGTIELVDEEKDNKLKQITNLSNNDKIINYQYSTSFANANELVDYVKNNNITERYMSYIGNDSIGSIMLSKNGTISYSAMINDSGFYTLNGTLDFNTNEIKIHKEVGFDTDTAILPNDISILDDVDPDNKIYKLDIAKCLELGILVETSNSTNAKAKSVNFLNLN